MQPCPDRSSQAQPGAAKIACSSCNLRELCLPVGFSTDELARLDDLVAMRRSVHRGESLFRRGDGFHAVYAVRTGFFKSCTTSADGREQVTGFQMAGELLGFDGLCEAAHQCDAVALEDAQVCVIPYARLAELAREIAVLQWQFHRVMSREIVREQGVMLLLSGMRADERLAAFLANLAQRLEARGFSASSLVLRMTRDEIGTYLGLSLETVSRCFSKLHEQGILDVRQKNIRILDPAALKDLVAGVTV